MQSRDTVVGVFDDRDDARDAINALRDAGLAAEEISVVARDRSEAGVLAEETGTEAGTGAATGALAGGLLGGVAGWLVGIGALAIPGVGPIIAAGPLAAALGGAALGATGGGLIGALTGAGVPEDEARWYDERVRAGGILVSANARGRHDEARAIMREYGGHDFSTGATTATARTWDQTAPEFRSRYESRYGAASRWENVEPAHRFGYDAATRARTSGSRASWRDEEPTLQSDWESRGYGAWDANRSHIRRGYDYGRGRTSFREYDEDDTPEMVGGSLVGGSAGAIAGGLAGGPAGAVAGAALGGAGGAAAGKVAGDAAETPPDEDMSERSRR